jgi:MEMO1 family protein
MKALRRASVAGTWYPGNPSSLAAEIDRYLAGVAGETPSGSLRAIVAPHAGLIYSGPVAAYAYHLARRTRCTALVLVGPSHFLPFEGVSIWPEGAWETPFGAVAIDEDLSSAIQAESPDIIELPAAHGREHSLEMQLPFVAHLLPGVPIVPLVMGRQTRAIAFALGAAIARAASSRSNTLLVASTDLSHYEDATTAERLDRVIIDRVEALDSEGVMSALEAEPRHACGGGPMVAVLEAAKRLGATEARLLQYGDSGDVSGDKSSVVGYMAAAVW